MTDDSELVLVWAPRGRDGELACQLLNRTGLPAEVCSTVDELSASARLRARRSQLERSW